MSTNKIPNRLIAEKSPYLLQHAHNPVDWYPWCEEAFEKAKKENKPVFLSIGYSTCHWCHVMAHESFEDQEVADLLNEHFVAIKVDREERPDIDSVYMQACQMLTGQGGWPLNVFLTPDQEPFYAGTYFPKESKYGRVGFKSAIVQLSHKYHQEGDHVIKAAKQLTEALQRKGRIISSEILGIEEVHQAFQQLSQSFDSIYGGFGQAPKFPIPHMLQFLMRYAYQTENEQAYHFVEKTLDRMAQGGIYDHIGFGFARYSTDQRWLVPHFEKMLYDNALLLYTYAEGYQHLKKEKYRLICEQVTLFLEREMVNERGAFYSAIDADTEGIEGKYYVWDKEEILEVLGDQGAIFCDLYGVTEGGNFEGKNILNQLYTNIEKVAESHQLSVGELDKLVEKARKKLLETREKRTYPHVDDKILTSWNGLMIAGLAKASSVFQNKNMLQLAEKAIDFVENHLFVDGQLKARYRDGEVKYDAYLDDYAFLLWAYIELYEATYKRTYIEKAMDLANNLIEKFWGDGGFYFTAYDSEELIMREMEIYDGAIPSGNGVASSILVRLGRLTNNDEWLDKVNQMWKRFYAQVHSYGSGHTFFLQSVLEMHQQQREAVIVGKYLNAEQLKKEIQKKVTYGWSIIFAEDVKEWKFIAPFITSYHMIDNQPTLYVCQNYACQQPTTNIASLLAHF
ncbi:thioredoxin domain-containing protein [Bacillus carboniphilus]|uniref:Thioredoxin domain-containing protein n=1 Tax=Bacillus carboniphilus TaxID=86663 RepID=A0ABY9JXR2_9BACI|nr:thioredoxin domain-containing protein [Bacillus carboniphilus]WLR43230.1 thioredoxin domain-containing protein [Bacillus carboniphilus]